MRSIFSRLYIWVLFSALGFGLISCGDFEKEIELDLPPFQSQLVVEAYLESNKNIKVAVMETQDYFGELKLPFINDATVVLTINNRTDTLMLNPLPDLKNLKYFNYVLNDSMIFHEGDIAYITVSDKKGRMITAETRWQNPVMLDSVKQSYRQNDTMALITAHFKDPGGVKNNYRFRVINFSDSNKVRMDIFAEDGLLDGQPTTFGTGYRFTKGDTLEVTLFSLTNEFYDFLKTANAAANANGNPFAQPAVIKSNVKGGSGIFTFLPYSRLIYIME